MVRLPWIKEFDVKIPMIMLVAGAAIALTAPLANAASTKKLNAAPVHKLVKHGKTGRHGKTAKPAGRLGQTGTSTPVTSTPPVYIYVPGYSGAAAAPNSVDECVSNGVNCTDEQLCQYWGENCSTGMAPSTDQTDTPAPVDTQPATTVSISESQSASSELPAASSGDAQNVSDMATYDSSDDC